MELDNSYSDLFHGMARFHFIGIGGIGMSGLAQMLAYQGHGVSGSDRAASNQENQRIFRALRNQGVTIFPQDGSYLDGSQPDALIYSTAIEESNPDFAVAGPLPRIHRSIALAAAVKAQGACEVAVSGSCGKTTVTAWLAETLHHLEQQPTMLSGGLVNSFVSERLAGNFLPGQGELMVYEADESDKSLLNYRPDYAVLLNIGTDHYEKDELLRIFAQFLENTGKGAVIEAGLADLLKKEIPGRLDVRTFTVDPDQFPKADYRLTKYEVTEADCRVCINGNLRVHLPVPGCYNAANLLAVMASLNLVSMPLDSSAVAAAEKFGGVWRRFDFAGKTSKGVSVFDDYAHNVEKIMSCIKAAREICPGRIMVMFQPHGYGPLKFMREELFRAVEETLAENEIFALLPVFYAGGTASFSPTSEEVVTDYSQNGSKHYRYFSDRSEAEQFISKDFRDGDLVLAMGARDNSLSDWTHELVGK